MQDATNDLTQSAIPSSTIFDTDRKAESVAAIPCRTIHWQYKEHHLSIKQFADFEATLSQAADHTEQDEQWPLFGQIWPAAAAMGRHLIDSKPTIDWKQQTILELGCGLALPGLLCAKWGAKVIATDVHPMVADFLEANRQSNGIASDRIQYQALDYSVPETLPPDWLESAGITYILACDVLYEPKLYPAIVESLLRLSQRPIPILIADPIRYALDEFLQLARSRGLQAEPLTDDQADEILLRLTQTVHK